ncbi:MAG: hypothetical protein H6Q87_1301, partial [candidate division NC10 bacterium]|nr:hypothetical protein [candidate division NC10 bacterium]
AGCLQKAREFVRANAYDKALNEIETVYGLDPGHAEAQELEHKILEAQRKQSQLMQVSVKRSREEEAWRSEEAHKAEVAREGREALRKETAETYRGMLKQAWVDGQPTNEEKAMLEVVRLSLGIAEGEHAIVEREIQIETYTEALLSAFRSGVLTREDKRTLENIRQLYGVTKEDHLVIEAGIMKDLRQSGG